MPKKYPKNLLIYEQHDDANVAALSDLMSQLKSMGYVAIGLELDDELNTKSIENHLMKEVSVAKALLVKTNIIREPEMRITVQARLSDHLVAYSKYLILLQSAENIGLKVFTFDKTIKERGDVGRKFDDDELYSVERETTMAKNMIKANMIYSGPVVCFAGLNHRPGLTRHLEPNIIEHINFDELLPDNSIPEADRVDVIGFHLASQASESFTQSSFIDAVHNAVRHIQIEDTHSAVKPG